MYMIRKATNNVQPEISFVIPIFNLKEYISKNVESLIKIDFIDIEMIYVDDGSTDRSYEILSTYLNDPRIRIYKKENSGCAQTRNYGLNLANGKNIIFLDGDDYIDPETFENIYQRHQELNLDILIWGYKAINLNGRILYENSSKYEMGIGHVMKGTDFLLKYECPETVWMQMYRAEFLKVNCLEFINELRYGEDTNFIPRAIYYANRIGFSDQQPIYYLIRENSTVRTKSIEKSYCSLKSGEILKEFKQFIVEDLTVKKRFDSIINREYSNCIHYAVEYDYPLKELFKDENLRQKIFYNLDQAEGLKYKIAHIMLRLKLYSPYKMIYKKHTISIEGS